MRQSYVTWLISAVVVLRQRAFVAWGWPEEHARERRTAPAADPKFHYDPIKLYGRFSEQTETMWRAIAWTCAPLQCSLAAS